jgi:hypothetical protein
LGSDMSPEKPRKMPCGHFHFSFWVIDRRVMRHPTINDRGSFAPDFFAQHRKSKNGQSDVSKT